MQMDPEQRNRKRGSLLLRGPRLWRGRHLDVVVGRLHGIAPAGQIAEHLGMIKVDVDTLPEPVRRDPEAWAHLLA